MRAEPLVSVIVNNFNYGRFLAEALQSVLGQAYPRVEAIVVDDGSTDESRAVIQAYARRYPGRLVPILKPNGGQASAMNAGFRASHGDIVCFLDSDDFWFGKKIESIVEPHRAHGFVQHNLLLNGGRYRLLLNTGDLSRFLKEFGLIRPCVPTSGMSFTRAVLEKILPMPENELKLCADVYLRSGALYFASGHSIDECLGVYRVHGDNGWVDHVRWERPNICEELVGVLNRKLTADGLPPIPIRADSRELAFVHSLPLESGRRYVLVGTGDLAIKVARRAQGLGSEVVGFVETGSAKPGATLLDRPLYTTKDLPALRPTLDRIVVACLSVERLYTQLTDLGYRYPDDMLLPLDLEFHLTDGPKNVERKSTMSTATTPEQKAPPPRAPSPPPPLPAPAAPVTTPDPAAAALLARWAWLRETQGVRKVYLFGGGKHTDRLLQLTRNRIGPQVAAILDDNAAPGQTKGDLPVLRPAAAERFTCDAIVLSTDTFQEVFRKRCRDLFGDTIPVVDLYPVEPGNKTTQPAGAPAKGRASQVTVALCIHKRTKHLAELARSLAAQKNPPPFEVVCVLNNSPAGVAQAARTAMAPFTGPIRFIDESRTGLSHARNRAIDECRTPWLAFLDDDAIPRDNWLIALISEATRVNAKAAGGRTVLRWDFERPVWFKPMYDRSLSISEFGSGTHPIEGEQYVVGANVLYHTDLFRDGLRFDARLGRQGDDLVSNEESLLHQTIEKKGFAIYYIGSAIVDHIVDPARVTPEWIAERSFAHGRSLRLMHEISPNAAAFQKETEERVPFVWNFLRNFRAYSAANSDQWRWELAGNAGYAYEHFRCTGATEVLTGKKDPNHLSTLAEEWGRRQFETCFAPQIAKLPAGSAVAIVGAGVTGKWLHDICVKAGIRPLALLDDYFTARLTPLPVLPVARIAELKVDAVILGTLRSEELLLGLLAKAGYKGPTITQKVQSKTIAQTAQGYKETKVPFAFSTSPNPRDGLPGRDWPLNVQIQTTSVCNARCVICPYSTSWHKKNPGLMDPAIVEKIIADLEHYRLGKLCLYLQNEPLCDRRWLQIARDAVKRLNFDRFELSTNASLLNAQTSDALCALLKGIPHEVWISFQGADREGYERLMGLNLDRTLDNLEYFLKQAAREGLTLQVHGFGEPRDPKSNKDRLFSKEAYNTFLNGFADQRGIPRFPIRFLRYHDRAGQLADDRLNFAFRRETLKDFYCHRVDSWLHVLYTGEVISCCHDYNRELVLGDLRTQSIRDFFRSETFLNYRDQALGFAESGPDFICKRCIGVGG